MNAWRRGGGARLGRCLAWLLVWLLPAQAIGQVVLLARGPAHQHVGLERATGGHDRSSTARHFHRADDATVSADATASRIDAAADDEGAAQGAMAALTGGAAPCVRRGPAGTRPPDAVPVLTGHWPLPHDRPPIHAAG